MHGCRVTAILLYSVYIQHPFITGISSSTLGLPLLLLLIFYSWSSFWFSFTLALLYSCSSIILVFVFTLALRLLLVFIYLALHLLLIFIFSCSSFYSWFSYSIFSCSSFTLGFLSLSLLALSCSVLLVFLTFSSSLTQNDEIRQGAIDRWYHDLSSKCRLHLQKCCLWCHCSKCDLTVTQSL